MVNILFGGNRIPQQLSIRKFQNGLCINLNKSWGWGGNWLFGGYYNISREFKHKLKQSSDRRELR